MFKKKVWIWVLITIVTLMILYPINYTPKASQCEYTEKNKSSFVDGTLRTDSPTIYNAKNYRLSISATSLPTTGCDFDFTAGFLGIFLQQPQFDSNGNVIQDSGQFAQVGIKAELDGIRWFVYSESTVTCLRGGPDDPNDNRHCYGNYDDIVELNEHHEVQLFRATNGYWYARVYDENGNYYNVARINHTSNQIYGTKVSFEEGYFEPLGSDPYIAGLYVFDTPRYVSGGTWSYWPKSANDQYSFITTIPSSICPSHYGFLIIPFTDPIWQAGTWQQPPYCSKLFLPSPIINDSKYPNPLVYSPSGNWTHQSGWTRAFNQNVSYTNINQSQVLYTFTAYSITRVYTMASNRGQAQIFLDGNTIDIQNDSVLYTPRWQVKKTWVPTFGTHTIQISNPGFSYIDLDAFIVDIPLKQRTGTYDDRFELFNFIGSWTYGVDWPSADKGTVSWTSTPEDAITWTFVGDSVTYVYTKAPNRGKAYVTIDGVQKELVDLYSSSTQWGEESTYYGLGSGIHTIHIAHSGRPNACSGTCYIDIDALIAISSP